MEFGGMEKTELKALLAIAKRGPLNCAVGIAKDASGLMMMHRTKAPKILEKQLYLKFPDAKDSRWGTVEITDDGIVKFTVNRPAAGLARKLKQAIHGSGFSKVSIVLEDGTLVDGVMED